MKSKIYLLIAVVLLAQTLNAQFTVGVKAGANLLKIDGKSFKEEFKTGYHAGAFAMIGLGDKFGIQPEVLWNQTKTRTDTTIKNLPSDAFSAFKNGEVKLDYLSIPVLLNYKFIGNFLSLQAGPQFGILLNKDKNLLQNGKEAFKGGDFSMLGGAQIKISKFVGSARYVVGLSNLNDIDNQDKWKSQGFQLSVGLSL
jgi:hypothetical protein